MQRNMSGRIAVCLLVLQLLSLAAAKEQGAASGKASAAAQQQAKPAASPVPENIRHLLLWVLQNDGVVRALSAGLMHGRLRCVHADPAVKGSACTVHFPWRPSVSASADQDRPVANFAV
jgi:hypothetical protein